MNPEPTEEYGDWTLIITSNAVAAVHSHREEEWETLLRVGRQ